MWSAAGFTTTVLFLTGNGNYVIGYQDKVGGQGKQSCTSTTVVVGP
jgi:hypothetical protein